MPERPTSYRANLVGAVSFCLDPFGSYRVYDILYVNHSKAARSYRANLVGAVSFVLIHRLFNSRSGCNRGAKQWEGSMRLSLRRSSPGLAKLHWTRLSGRRSWKRFAPPLAPLAQRSFRAMFVPLIFRAPPP